MQSSKQMDLALCPDRSVYHLKLHPEEIADKVILVGDPDRVAMVSAFFDQITVKKSNREFLTHTGIYKNKPVSVVATGIGTDNIDIVLTELDAAVNIDLKHKKLNPDRRFLSLVRIGTCGSLQKSIPVGSAILGEMSIGLDNLMFFYDYVKSHKETEVQKILNNWLHAKEIPLQTYVVECSPLLYKKFSPAFEKGITLTAPGFYGPQGRKIHAEPAYPNLLDVFSGFQYNNLFVTNFEMETSAIYGMANILEHDAITIDLVIANRITGEFEPEYHEKMNSLIVKVLDILTSD